jgi:hypothetical protein
MIRGTVQEFTAEGSDDAFADGVPLENSAEALTW